MPLRPRLVAAFALVAALTAVAVAVSSYVLASRARIRSAAETAAAQARVLLRFAALVEELPLLLGRHVFDLSVERDVELVLRG